MRMSKEPTNGSQTDGQDLRVKLSCGQGHQAAVLPIRHSGVTTRTINNNSHEPEHIQSAAGWW